MKVKATEKFKKLGTDNCFQQLEPKDYFSLKRGEVLELRVVPGHLITGGYIEKVKKDKGE